MQKWPVVEDNNLEIGQDFFIPVVLELVDKNKIIVTNNNKEIQLYVLGWPHSVNRQCLILFV